MLTLITLIIIIAIFINKNNRKKALNKIYLTLIQTAGLENVKRMKLKAFDFEMLYNNKIFLIKMIYHPSRHEINVNSKDYWQINRGVVSSRKSGEQMKGVYDLINYNLADNGYPKNTIKLYVIYPSSKRMMKVINECEMKFIKPEMDIYGCRINNYTDLKENIDKF